MTVAEWLGSFGVALLLLAFGLNLVGRMDRGSRGYQVLNAVGAGIAAWASYLIGFFPFVVLEGTWCLVSVLALLQAPARDRAGAE